MRRKTNTMMKKNINRTRFGFTLIELVVVAGAMGILAAIVVPKFANAHDESKVVATGEDILSMAQAIEQYHNKHGYWPAEVSPGQMPPELSTAFKSSNPFAKPCPIGNVYDYGHITINNSHTVTLSISPGFTSEDTTIVDAQALDAYLDDGVLNTGRFQRVGNGYVYRISN